jgi:hypothetical protein
VSGLDNALAALGRGAPVWAVLGLALVLGLRHATDPDHLAAVTTLVASDAHDGPREAGRLGLAWGAGHALTLLAFGAPVVAIHPYLPEAVQRIAETVIGIVLVVLGMRLLRQWRRMRSPQAAARRHTPRRPAAAFGMGLLHGFGGSAGAGVLILAAFPSRSVALASLAILAAGTTVSMTVLSTGFGVTLARGSNALRYVQAAPLIAVCGIAFGLWYAYEALHGILSL